MGWFGRRREERTDDAPDSALPFLTATDAAEIRRLTQQAFAAAGIDAVIHEDHLAGTDGHKYGLWNVAASCHNAPGGRREWPAVVERHVRALLAPTAGTADLPDEEVRARTFLRLYGAGALPADPTSLSYTRPVADDLVEALALDFPDSVVTLTDGDVARFDPEELRRAGLENLLREPVDEIESIDLPAGGSIQVVYGESVYTASRILAMRDLLMRVYGEREYPNGVLVTVAHRHQIGLHPLDGPEALPVINALAGFAKNGFDDAPGGISPHLYWWHGGAFERISRVSDDGAIGIEVRPGLAEALERVVGRG
ncbi:hypothetical protein ATJ97_0745 [Georgenia soli]|uniref:Uncharacterized protein n=1 Tax=Georgenia soli TaxID=638953 RepID=A0A2A9EJ33_9MICO|nr:hypothetical protein [Georgenia soli]PFG38272.1 hypothetical protein ATJ97_0745 [Georgenia soli]